MSSYRTYHPAVHILLSLAEGIQYGELIIVLPNGEEHMFTGDQAGHRSKITLNSPSAAAAFLTGGGLGFQEAYNKGLWQTDDLESFFLLMIQNEEALAKASQGKWWVRFLTFISHKLRRNTRAGARRNISAHYDLGNDFYGLWLDPTMTYSSALFEEAEQDLSAAQTAKYRALAEKINITPDKQVLEIGCGWGGFAEFVGKEIGAPIRSITISKEQYKYAKKRIFDAGLAEKVDVDLIDYRDVTETYDRIASIEMFEAVGQEYWPTYFESLRDRLKQGGEAALQVITIDGSRFDNYRRNPDYIQKHIFPGGMLPSIAALRLETQKAGLTWDGFTQFGRDYAKTLRIWNDSFQAAWSEIKALGEQFDEEFRRIWEQYLLYCAAGFEAGTIDVVQCRVKK